MFQRQRVDMLLAELLRKFPIPLMLQQHHAVQQTIAAQNQNGNGIIPSADAEPPILDAIKQEPADQPQNNGVRHGDNDMDVDIKIEGDKSDMKPPPEKKMKL